MRRGELGVKQILRCRNLPIDAGRWERRMIVSKIVSGRQFKRYLAVLIGSARLRQSGRFDDVEKVVREMLSERVLTKELLPPSL